jgi:hypothetical protein
MNNVLTDPTIMSLVQQQVVTNTSMCFGGSEMFARFDMRVLALQLAKVIESEEHFKKACVWAWSSSIE